MLYWSELFEICCDKRLPLKSQWMNPTQAYFLCLLRLPWTLFSRAAPSQVMWQGTSLLFYPVSFPSQPVASRLLSPGMRDLKISVSFPQCNPYSISNPLARSHLAPSNCGDSSREDAGESRLLNVWARKNQYILLSAVEYPKFWENKDEILKLPPMRAEQSYEENNNYRGVFRAILQFGRTYSFLNQ